MPDLSTSLHLDMLRNYSRTWRSLPFRLWRAVSREISSRYVYGLEWGDPDIFPPLRFVKDRYVLPYVSRSQQAVEIGPGGGRWTRYLLGFDRLYAVDYHSELLEELKKNFDRSNMSFIKNGGTDFPGIKADSIDYLFSFGTFVHLSTELIEAYLQNMRPILRSGANAVIQYSDKTKIMAQMDENFSDNSPDKMRQMVLNAGYEIVEEDLTTLWHSSIIRFTK